MALKNNQKGLIFLFFLLLIPGSECFSQQADLKYNGLATSSKKAPDHVYAKDTAYVHNLIKSAQALRYRHTDSMAKQAHKILELSKSISYPEGDINARILLSAHYSDQGQSQKAIEELEQARISAQEGGYDHLEIKTLNALGNEWGYKGQKAKSLRTYLEAIELAKEAENQPMLSILYENVANPLYFKSACWEKHSEPGISSKKNRNMRPFWLFFRAMQQVYVTRSWGELLVV